MFWQFLFKLFRLEYETPECKNCETLRLLLENERHDKNRLLDKLVVSNVPESNQSREIPLPITPKHLPFSAIRSRLERQSREEAEQIRTTEKHRKLNQLSDMPQSNSVEDLEAFLGLEETENGKVNVV
tara:strand:+ start:838 stop:1221 length:384 start_codon:yes stop_codon:yes gene_type:complete